MFKNKKHVFPKLLLKASSLIRQQNARLYYELEFTVWHRWSIMNSMIVSELIPKPEIYGYITDVK